MNFDDTSVVCVKETVIMKNKKVNNTNYNVCSSRSSYYVRSAIRIPENADIPLAIS